MDSFFFKSWPFLEKMEEIPGFFSVNEAVVLDRAIKEIRGKKAIEIGTLLGRSAYVIAQTLISDGAKLYCIDPFINRKREKMPEWDGYHGKEIITGDEQLEIFNNNLREKNLIDIVQVIRDFSQNSSEIINDEVDFIFIDGSHNYKDVLRDYEEYEKKLRVGGYIAFHDVYIGSKNDSDGPYRVVKDNLMNVPNKQNHKWVKQILADCLFLAQKFHN